MVAARIEDPNVTARRADAKNLGARGMLVHPGESRTDSDARDRFELHEIDRGDVAVGRGDVGRKMQVRAQERGSMLAEKQDNSPDGKRGQQEVDAEVLRPVHVGDAILPCI